MNYGFWEKLKKPIMVLAPMANVTDAPFRRVIAHYGKPDVMWTEFVSCEGLLSPGRDKLLIDFIYSDIERPIVAQIFGNKPDQFYKCAQLVAELGFDGIDINMGCPVKEIDRQGAGASLIKTPELAKKIILETKRGAGNLPVSVKTRLGYNKIELDVWLPHVLETEPAAVTLHLRTRKEMSKVPAHWEEMPRAREIVDQFFAHSPKPFLLGNGDVASIEEGSRKVAEYGADGVMIGRGIFGNPWLFSGIDPKIITLSQRLLVLKEHILLFEQLLLGKKSYDNMRKHFKAYIQSFDNAKDLRIKLMETQNCQEAIALIDDLLVAL